MALKLMCSFSISSNVSFYLHSLACSNGHVRLYNSTADINSNGTLAITGIFEICVDGEWATVCDDGSAIDPDNQDALERACYSMGYTGEQVHKEHGLHFEGHVTCDSITHYNECTEVQNPCYKDVTLNA